MIRGRRRPKGVHRLEGRYSVKLARYAFRSGHVEGVNSCPNVSSQGLPLHFLTMYFPKFSPEFRSYCVGGFDTWRRKPNFTTFIVIFPLTYLTISSTITFKADTPEKRFSKRTLHASIVVC